MFDIRPIPYECEIDYRAVYTQNNVKIDGLFKPADAWLLFEMPNHKKYAIRLVNLLDYDYETFEELVKNNRYPSIQKGLYSHMKSYAELNVMMRGHKC